MRPRILYELSRHLAILLEEGMRGGTGEGGSQGRIPVFLCHPLDPIQAEDPRREDLAAHTAGILYPVRVIPEPRYRQVGPSLEPARQGQFRDRFRRPSLWLRARFVFLVAGGTLEMQLEAIAASLRTLHDAASIELPEWDESGEPAEGGVLPLRIVEDSEGWRELGLTDHRLSITFEVAFSIRSARVEEVDRVLEREVTLEDGSEGAK
jgi:hypothetical protein